MSPAIVESALDSDYKFIHESFFVIGLLFGTFKYYSAGRVLAIHLPTIVNVWNLLLEINDRRQIVDSEFLRRLLVVDLYELDPVLVAIVVDLFHLVQDLHRVLVAVIVCKHEGTLYHESIERGRNNSENNAKRYEQNRTTRLSTFPISVFKVLAVTSSITSSSSPVLLFAISHSNTSSSLLSSSENTYYVLVFVYLIYFIY